MAKVLALILARGGSQGIPKKNIKLLHGKPLLAYTIEEAKKSNYIDRILLSTDDHEIAQVGKEYGAQVPFMRPKELATNEASSIDTILHALFWMKDHQDYWPDYLILLQPTSPLRQLKDIDTAIELILKEKGDSLVSMCEAKAHPYWLKKIIDGQVVSYTDQGVNINRRQDLSQVYSLNGAIYLARTDLLVENRSFYVGKTLPYLMPKERSVDIDDFFDWKIAEALLEERV